MKRLKQPRAAHSHLRVLHGGRSRQIGPMIRPRRDTPEARALSHTISPARMLAVLVVEGAAAAWGGRCDQSEAERVLLSKTFDRTDWVQALYDGVTLGRFTLTGENGIDEVKSLAPEYVN